MNKKGRLLVLFVAIIGSGLLYHNHTNKAINLKTSGIYQKLDKDTESVSEILNGEFVIQIGEKFGILGEDSKKIKDVEYDLITRLNGNLYFLKKDGKGSIFNSKNKKEIKVDELAYIKKDLFKVGKDEKFGVVNSNLDNVMDIKYLYVGNNSHYIMGYNDKEYDILSLKDLKKVDIDNKAIRLGIGKYFYTIKDNKLGIIDEEGKEIRFPQYDNLLNLNDSNITVGYKNEKMYLLNLSKGIEKEISYENFGEESNDIIMVLKDGKIGYINDEGEEVVAPLYDGGFKAKKDQDFYQVKLADKWLLLDSKGKSYKELEYDDMGEYEEGYILVLKDEYFGYIDKNGEIVIPLVYNYGENFKNGLAIVSNDKGTGVINKKGEAIIPLENDEVMIEKDYIYVKKDNKYGLFGINGKEILATEYDRLGKVSNREIFFRKNFEVGYMKLEEKM